jgi:hypothetical protein
MVELARVEADQRHEVQGLGVVGVSFKRLPAAELGLEISSRAQVAENGLMERSARRRGRGGINSLGDSLVLATIHDLRFKMARMTDL